MTRRPLALAASLTVLALGLVATGVVIAVGDRFHFRTDVTTSGEQALAPRTRTILDQIEPLGGAEIVVAIDAAAVEPWARQTVRDVLDLFRNAGAVRAEEIDVGTAEGQAAYAALLQRLVEREQPGVEQHVEAVTLAANEADEAAAEISGRLAPSLPALAQTIAGDDANAAAARAGLSQWAAMLRVTARQLSDAGSAARAALSEPDPTLPIPPLDTHETALKNALLQRAAELDSLAGDLREVAALPGAETARPLAEQVEALRDRLAREADALTRLPRLEVLRVARALGSSEVALVIGPPGAGVAGIDIRTLYEPTVVAADGGRTIGDVRLRAEELLASALASVASQARPIVVLVHGEARPILDAAAFFSGIRQRLAQRGIDMAEWVASQDPEPPALTDLDPDGTRPVVYVTLSPDASAAAQSQDDLPGPQRATNLGRALAYLLAAREPVLVSLNPSVLPAYGETDPVVAPLTDLGLRASTQAPLLRRLADARDPRVFTEFTALPPKGEHPILKAAANLPTTLSWPVPLSLEPGSSLDATPLLRIEDSPGTWGETQWLRLWQTPAQQRPLLPDAPRFDPGVDLGEGPWTVALAASRADAPTSRAGRLVVVGSNAWYADPLAFRHESGDGRVVLASPGNAELFEAAVLWLAGQDELIAASASARARPLIRPLEPSTVAALRWGLIGGLPVLTLLIGVLWRLARG